MKLTRFSPRHYPQARALYEAAFPECERRPTDEWLQMIEGHYFFHAWEVTDENDMFCGFITAWQFSTFTYVEHFAINPAQRGKGHGGRTLDCFINNHKGTPVVLEVEPPLTNPSRRRFNFYRRHGLSVIPCPYAQPPYRSGDKWITLCLMATNAKFVEQHFKTLRETIYCEVYGAVEQTTPFFTIAAYKQF